MLIEDEIVSSHPWSGDSSFKKASTLFRDAHNNREAIIMCMEEALMHELSGNFTVDHMAAMFCVSKRTFSRKLRALGISYRKLYDNVKFRMARDYLEQREHRITDIASNLGYNDASNFSKAFRNWQGCSPREYRAQVC